MPEYSEMQEKVTQNYSEMLKKVPQRVGWVYQPSLPVMVRWYDEPPKGGVIVRMRLFQTA